jgi:hypothetical protein
VRFTEPPPFWYEYVTSYFAAEPAVNTPESCQSLTTAASARAAPLDAPTFGRSHRKFAFTI